MDLVKHFHNARSVWIVSPGTEIFKTGEPASVMYVLIEGAASVIVGNTIVEIAGAGALLGEMALIDSQERSATVIARTRCRLVPIEPDHFELLIRETPAFARHVMNLMMNRLRRMNENLVGTQGISGVRTRVTTKTARSLEAELPPRPFRVA
jgi:CRP-like cAMP-binding protein